MLNKIKIPEIILASSSKYRKILMERLGLEFTVDAPNIDEHAFSGGSIEEQVKQIAQEKANVISKKYTDALIIGSDQVAILENKVLTKPGDHGTALNQLRKMCGQKVTFLTALSVINTGNSNRYIECVPYYVTFRNYDDDEVIRYLEKDKPFDCAGSFKSEEYGITLVEKMEGTDPTSLIGLPLIRLSHILRKEGIKLP